MIRRIGMLALVGALLLAAAGCTSTEEVAATDSDFLPYRFEEGLITVGLRHTEPWRDGLGRLRALPNTSIRLVYSINFRQAGGQAELDAALATLRELPFTLHPSGARDPSGYVEPNNTGFFVLWTALNQVSAEQEAAFAQRADSLGLVQHRAEDFSAPVVHLNVPQGQEKTIARQLRASGLYRWVELNYFQL